jgi:hypothetical protein
MASHPCIRCSAHFAAPLSRSGRHEHELKDAGIVQEGPAGVLKSKFVLITRAAYEERDFSGDQDIFYLAE